MQKSVDRQDGILRDNIVHRWLRETEQDGADLWPTVPSPVHLPVMPAPAFVPLQADPTSRDCIHLELTRNDLTLRIDWPMSHAQSCLQTLLALLR